MLAMYWKAKRWLMPVDRIAVAWLGIWVLVAAVCYVSVREKQQVALGWTATIADSPLAAAASDTPSELTKSIEEIKPGDVVLAFNEHTGVQSPQKVAHVFRHITHQIRVLEVRSPDGSQTQLIRTTDEHPFWVTGRGWVPAGKLSAGNMLSQRNGDPAEIVSVSQEYHAEGIPVFNIEVESDHTYFVAEEEGPSGLALLVHNKEKLGGKHVPPPKLTQPKTQGLFKHRNRKDKWDRQSDVNTVLLNDAQLESIRVYPDKNGNYRWARDGKLVNVNNIEGKNQVLFNMDENGNMYVFDSSKHPEFANQRIHHSSLSGGFDKKAISAGHVSIKDGKLLYVDGNSGHYFPQDVEFVKFVGELKAQGVDLSQSQVYFSGYHYAKEGGPFAQFYTEPTNIPEWFPPSNIPR